MKLDKVILAADDNPAYLQLWPLVACFWKVRIGVEPVLLHVTKVVAEPKITEPGVYALPLVPGLPSGFQSQIARLYGPLLFPDDVCILSDIDMLPLSKSYYHDAVAGLDDDSVVVFSADAYESRREVRYPMCYVAGRGAILTAAFGVEEDFASFARRLARFDWGWSTDELYMSQAIARSEHQKRVLLRRGWHKGVAHRRLDRTRWSYDPALASADYYVDSHLPRPIDQHLDSVTALVRDYGRQQPPIGECLDRFLSQIVRTSYDPC